MVAGAASVGLLSFAPGTDARDVIEADAIDASIELQIWILATHAKNSFLMRQDGKIQIAYLSTSSTTALSFRPSR